MSVNNQIFTNSTRFNQEEHRIRRYNRILEGINRIFSNVVQAKTEEELGNTCLTVALEVTDSEIGFIGEVDSDGLLNHIAVSDMDWNQCMMSDKKDHPCTSGDFILHDLYNRVIDSGKGFFANGPPSHPDTFNLFLCHPSLVSFLVVPLIQEGKTVGMLGVANREGGYSCEQLEDLEAIAPAVTQAVKRKREEHKRKHTEEALAQAYKKLERQSDELQVQAKELNEANGALSESEKRFELLSEANSLLLSSKDPEAVIQIIAEKVMSHLNCDMFFNYVFDKIQNRLRLNAFGGINVEVAKEIEWLDIGVAICGCVGRDGCRIISEDVQHNGDRRADLVRSMGIQAYACQPLHIGEKTIGTLSFGTRSRKGFTGDDLALMSTVADQVSVAIERKQAEEALWQSESRHKVDEAVASERQRFFNVLETLPVMVSLLTSDYHYTFINRSFREKFGESNDQKKCYEQCFGLTKPCRFCEGYKVLETGKPHNWVATTQDGSIIDVYHFPFTDVDGSPMILEMNIDITERKKAEESLAKIEKARKKEIHHRIKNNLQVISSLLDLQADKFNNRDNIKDFEVLEAFRESQARVISMAFIHEELHKGEGFNKLDFSSYIKELVDNLFLSYRLGNSDINLNIDLEENLFFNIDTAVPLGMIINELVSNSLKHAFVGRSEGEIRIKFNREENGKCINSIEVSKKESYKNIAFVLTISDNGVGIPENLDIENLDSLGIQLVTSLVDQLDGELELRRNNGTTFIIRFTLTENSDQASAPVMQQLFE